ncbi:MAG: type VI secretion system-associated FHA domain protein TagH [Acuticoccus sp.]
MVALRLKLDNMINLPDGGPTFLDVEGRRSVDIGRNTYLDWTLPDPSRVVSGRHCEIHFRDGGYWLTDISTNGTYLNGSDKRLTEPTRLRNGDRIAIGDYLINVTVEDEDAPARTVEAPPEGPASGASAALWDVPDERAAPAERDGARKARAAARPVHADVLDWISELPAPAKPEDETEADSTAEAGDIASADAPAPLAEEDTSPPADDAWTAAPPPEPDEPARQPAPEAGAPAPEADTVEAEAIADEPLPGEDTPATEPEDDETLWEAPPAPVMTEDAAEGANEPVVPLPAAVGAAEPAHERGFGPAARATETHGAVTHGVEFERFIVALAAALDVPRDRLEARSPEELAQRLGAFVNLTIAGMQRLLKARSASRGYMRAGPGTQVQAIGNNPLKFMPTPGAAADVLFGAQSRSYLGIEETLDESFADLGAHQMALYGAMQGAVERMLADLDPAAIEESGGDDKGFALPGSKKSRHWDTYKERFNARASQHDNGMIDVFMMCFADAYDRAINNRD